MPVAIRMEHVGKKYRLGLLNRSALYQEIQSWWARRRGRIDPHSFLHEINTDRPAEPYDFWALRDVTFDIMQGEAIGILGENGSGKSTLLKILSRITGPTTGKVYIDGRVASLLEVGTGFHNELTGRENVYLNGAILGMSPAATAARFDDIVSFAEVEQFIDTPVKRYSSGMRMRLAFAVAAHLESDILIIDEVLAVGDARFRDRCMAKIEETRRSGRTVIFVSHDSASVRRLCDRGVVLVHGEAACIAAQDEAVDFYHRSIGQVETKGLLSSVPVP